METKAQLIAKYYPALIWVENDRGGHHHAEPTAEDTHRRYCMALWLSGTLPLADAIERVNAP